MKRKLGFIIFFVFLHALSGSVFAGQDVELDDNNEVLSEVQEMQKDATIFPIKIYQDYISSVDGDRCPMEPTCSQYCIEAFKKHGALLGWIMCSDRLMRDGRDETRLSDPIWINGEKRTYDPVNNNDFWRQ